MSTHPHPGEHLTLLHIRTGFRQYVVRSKFDANGIFPKWNITPDDLQIVARLIRVVIARLSHHSPYLTIRQIAPIADHEKQHGD
jgi:hypothetical protein